MKSLLLLPGAVLRDIVKSCGLSEIRPLCARMSETGLNVGADVFVGVIVGGMENVSGGTINTNLVFGPISLTFIGDPKTGKFIGGTLGIGPTVPIPFQASLTGAITGTFTLRDLLRFLSPTKAEASTSPATIPSFSSVMPPKLGGRK